jgi:hypothetical protein
MRKPGFEPRISMMTVDPSVYIIPSLPTFDGSYKRRHLEVESIFLLFPMFIFASFAT